MNTLAPPRPARAVLRYQRQSTRCPKSGKYGYRTKRKALRVAEKHQAAAKVPVRAYFCSSCDRYHLTTMPQQAVAA